MKLRITLAIATVFALGLVTGSTLTGQTGQVSESSASESSASESSASESSASESSASESSAEQDDFLERLVGTWRMEGRGRGAQQAPWYSTRSSMDASLKLKDRALVRHIEAPVIALEALDVLWRNEETGEYTYIYLSTNNADPVILTGGKTEADELVVFSADKKTRTVIRIEEPSKMVARDYRVGEDGVEWMSRDVNHYRED